MSGVMGFEIYLIDFLLCPPAQDAFKTWCLEAVFMENIRNVHINQIEDVIQILHKCMDQLVKGKNLKIKYNLY
jgi:hypothetical protein